MDVDDILCSVQIPGFCCSTTGVWGMFWFKLNQTKYSLYGLNQVRREFSELLASSLMKLTLWREQSLVDSCFSLLMCGYRVRVIVGIHVYDMIIVSLDRDGLQLKEELSKSFQLRASWSCRMVYGMFI